MMWNENDLTAQQYDPPAPGDWERVKAHFDDVVSLYESLAGKPGINTNFALEYVFQPLAERFAAGEHTQELYDEMAGVE